MKVLITDYEYQSIAQEQELIQKLGAELVDLQNTPGLTLEQAVVDADAVIVQYAQMTKELIDAMTTCKMIIKYGIGVNNIDVEAATAKGIYVCNVPDYGIDEVSNHAIALMMTLHRKLPTVQRSLRQGVWGCDSIIPIRRLEGSTLGLLGFGRIPKMVARKMSGFGMRILAHDPYVSADEAREQGVELVSVEQLCRESDVISVHCPLNDATTHMLNKDTFAIMKPHVIIVNTARGAVICEEDLIAALRNGQVAAAGLDTFEQEPIQRDNPLLSMENVICTPHCAWYSVDAISAVQRKAAEEVVNVLSGNPPFNALNRDKIG